MPGNVAAHERSPSPDATSGRQTALVPESSGVKGYEWPKASAVRSLSSKDMRARRSKSLSIRPPE